MMESFEVKGSLFSNGMWHFCMSAADFLPIEHGTKYTDGLKVFAFRGFDMLAGVKEPQMVSLCFDGPPGESRSMEGIRLNRID